MAALPPRRLSSTLRARVSPRAELGLITLEWLLIVGAIAGLAASSVLAVQIVVDDSTDRPAQRDVRVIDAEIAAATVASEATKIVEENPGDYQTYLRDRDPGFLTACQEVANEYSDVVQPTGDWEPPTTVTGPPPELENLAKCNLTRL